MVLSPKFEEIELGHGPDFAPSKSLYYKRQAPLILCLAVQIAVVYVSIAYYDRIYILSPIGAPILSACTMSGLSQGLIQVSVKKKINVSNLIKFYIWGLINGLFTKCWTDQLNEALSSTLHKVAADQLIGNPVCIFLFFCYISYCDKLDFYAQIKDKFMSTFKTSLIIWPFASFAMFYFVPAYMSVPFNSCVNLLWTVILGLKV